MPKGTIIKKSWPAWAAAETYRIGDYVIPTAANVNGHVYVCTIAGISGAVEPTWPTNTTTVADNAATWRDVGDAGGRYAFVDPITWRFVAADANYGTQMLALKLREPPRGANGTLAQIIKIDHTNAPVGFNYYWDDTIQTADNGGTILRPVRSGEAWVTGTVYKVGDIVNNSGNEYLCVIAGTSGAAPGPTATPPAARVTDGTVQWQWTGDAKWGRWFRGTVAV